MTDREHLFDLAVGRARRRLAAAIGRPHAEQELAARSALRVLVAATVTQPPPEDPPIAATLQMPSWSGETGPYPVVVVGGGSLLGLLEEEMSGG